MFEVHLLTWCGVVGLFGGVREQRVDHLFDLAFAPALSGG
jgi:hypothetical protein